MSRRRLDLGQVILVAAAATGADRGDLVADADITLLALVTQRTRTASTAPVAAAEMLVGVAAGRPFRSGNAVAAWALAAHVADLRRWRLTMTPRAAADLVGAVIAGSLDEAEVAGLLAPALHRRQPLTDAVARSFTLPERSLESVVWACPRCQQPVIESPFRSSILVAAPDPADVVTDCARRRGAHGPASAVRRYESVRVFAAPELTPSGA